MFDYCHFPLYCIALIGFLKKNKFFLQPYQSD